MRHVLLFALLLGSWTAARADAPPGVGDVCTKDSDCVLDDFKGCCQMCPGRKQPFSKKELERRRAVCQAASCSPPKYEYECTSVTQRPEIARCQASRCVAVPAEAKPGK